jgi:serine/threonine protein kinase
MNYEELLESRNGAAMVKETIPFGSFYRKMIESKYAHVVDLRHDLLDSLKFCDALMTECLQNRDLNHKNLMHFTLSSDSAGLYGVTVETGSYRTFERLLLDSPAVVAQSGFIDRTVKELLEVTSYLHEQGIFHICYAPDNVFVRRGDHAPMLLFHGSAYRMMNDQQELYGDVAAAYIAPEVLEEGVFDARADIFSIGKFIEYLYSQSEVPIELKGVLKKATDVNPEKRYQTPEEMLDAIGRRKNTKKSIIFSGSAVIVAAIVLGAYFTLIPERESIDFVEPVPNEELDALDDDGFDPSALDVLNDSMENVDPKKLKEYEAKSEQIFRKNYTEAAERILSKIYNNQRMNSTEKTFSASSKSTMEELVKQQIKLGGDAGLPDARSQLIASEIIEIVTARLKKQAALPAEPTPVDEINAVQAAKNAARMSGSSQSSATVNQPAEKPKSAADAAAKRQESVKKVIERQREEERNGRIPGNN